MTRFADPARPTLAELDAIMARTGGSLYLGNTPISTLPDGLTVPGELELRHTPISTLPDSLTVGLSLDLRNTFITTFPDGLTVGGAVYLRNTPIPIIYVDPRGYELRRVMCGPQEWWLAGCRRFTDRAAAIEHWGSPDYPDPERGAAFVAAINATPMPEPAA